MERSDRKDGGKREEGALMEWEDLFEEEEVNKEMEVRSSLIKIDIEIEPEWKLKAVIDTGATQCCINKDLYEDLKERKYIKGELPVSGVKLLVAVGRRFVKVKIQVLFDIKWKDKHYLIRAWVVEGFFSLIILGLDWMRENKIVINCGEEVVTRTELGSERESMESDKEEKVSPEEDNCLVGTNVEKNYGMEKKQNADGKIQVGSLGVFHFWEIKKGDKIEVDEGYMIRKNCTDMESSFRQVCKKFKCLGCFVAVLAPHSLMTAYRIHLNMRKIIKIGRNR